MHTRCPDEIALAALADGTLPDAERRAAVEHVADCESCLATLGMLGRMSVLPAFTDVPSTLIARAEFHRSRTTTWRVPAAAAAALVLASTALLYPLRDRSSSPHASVIAPEKSDVRSSAVAEQVIVTSPREDATLPPEVRWEPIAQATGYLVSITHEDGSLVWQDRTDLPSYPVKLSLEPGRSYFVLVKAFLPGGRAVTSRAVRFHVETQ